MSNRVQGLTLIELLVVLAIVGILAAAAAPRMDRYVELVRARAALDLVVVELYRARMMAVRSARPARLTLGTGATGCVDRVRIDFEGADGARRATSRLDVGSVCLRHNGDSVLHFSSRGMLRPPGRSIYSTAGAAADSVVVSVAGRVRRSY